MPRGAAWVACLAGLGGIAGCGHSGPAAFRDAGDVPADTAPDAAPIDAPDASPFDAAPGTPDLQFIDGEMRQTVTITSDPFRDTDCEVVEGCVGAAGQRTLLRFDTVTANRGTADVVVGVPPPPGESNDVFEWSPCHMHHHVKNYASYELLDATGTVVLTARKQAFCLEDGENIQPGVPATGYSCTDQGITHGWADVYSRYLPCQWIDVTDVPPDTYTLRVVVNPLRTLPESNYDNNTFTVSVHFQPRRAGSGRCSGRVGVAGARRRVQRLALGAQHRVDHVALVGLRREPVARERHRAVADLDDRAPARRCSTAPSGAGSRSR